MSKKQIAIARGHTWGTGASGWGDIDETDYNRKLAYLIEKELTERGWLVYNHEHKISSYERRINAYVDAAKKYVPEMKCMLDLHCNAYDGSARGHEFLYHQSPNLSKSLAKHFQESFPNSVARGSNGIKQRSTGNGSYFLRHSPVPACISEPFFIDNAEEYNFFTQPQNMNLMAKAFADGIEDYFGVATPTDPEKPEEDNTLENRIADLEERVQALEDALEKRYG